MAGGPSFQSLAVLQAAHGAEVPNSSTSSAAPGPSPPHHAAQSGPIKKRRKRGEADGKRYPCDQCDKCELRTLARAEASRVHTLAAFARCSLLWPRRAASRPVRPLACRGVSVRSGEDIIETVLTLLATLRESAFSRPDHLSRHKLNHNPSQIYECTRYDPSRRVALRGVPD